MSASTSAGTASNGRRLLRSSSRGLATGSRKLNEGLWGIGTVLRAIEPYPFDRVYGGWWRRNIASNGRAALEASAALYIERIEGRASPKRKRGRAARPSPERLLQPTRASES